MILNDRKRRRSRDFDFRKNFKKIIFEKFSPGGSLIRYGSSMFHRCSLIL